MARVWNAVKVDSPATLVQKLNQLESEGNVIGQLLPASPMGLAFIVYFCEEGDRKSQVSKNAANQEGQKHNAQHG